MASKIIVDQIEKTGGSLTALTLPTSNASASEFLQNDGAGALSWASASAGFNSVQEFTSGGTWSRPTGVTKILVFVTGGGAGGKYMSSDYGTGGGAAATAIKFIDVSAIPSVTVAIGAGGVGGDATNPYYSPAGGDSTFGVAPATVHCTGGGGGITSGVNTPGPGGTATGGDLNVTGGGGTYGGGGTGQGGASFWGSGTSLGYESNYVSPLANNIYGAGGGGSRWNTAGSGGPGVCFVMEFK